MENINTASRSKDRKAIPYQGFYQYDRGRGLEAIHGTPLWGDEMVHPHWKQWDKVQVKAMLKEAANILKGKFNLNAFKARVAERVFVIEDRISLGVVEPTGSFEEHIHAMTPQGPISALRRLDYVEQAEIRFRIRALDEPMVTKGTPKRQIFPAAYLPILLEYAQERRPGGGTGRQGYGQFDLISIEEGK